MELSPEFSLLVDCCRHAFGDGEGQGVEEHGDVQWPLFLRLVRFHRVQGLVWALPRFRERIPDEIAQSIAADASTIAADNLRASVEANRLLKAFLEAKLDALFVKGLTLGALCYPNLAVKSAVDIDLLVAEANLTSAADLLQRAGYQLDAPAGLHDADGLLAWHQPGKESTWVRAEPRSIVDLHTRLSDHPRLIPSIGLGSPRRTVEIGNGTRLPTLRDEELFAYLCVHGASSAWFRLKWITDLAALLEPRPANEIEHFYRRSQDLGAGRAAGQALLLADRLYGTLRRSVGLRSQLNSDRASRWLYSQALQQLSGRSMAVEPTQRPLGTARIHLTQLMLLPGMSFKISELVRQFRAAMR